MMNIVMIHGIMKIIPQICVYRYDHGSHPLNVDSGNSDMEFFFKENIHHHLY